MIVHVKFIRVTGKLQRNGNMKALLERACYGHSKVIEYVEGGDNEFVANVRTEEQTEVAVRIKAEYQAGRFMSFLWAAKVYDNPGEIEAEFGSFNLTA